MSWMRYGRLIPPTLRTAMPSNALHSTTRYGPDHPELSLFAGVLYSSTRSSGLNLSSAVNVVGVFKARDTLAALVAPIMAWRAISRMRASRRSSMLGSSVMGGNMAGCRPMTTWYGVTPPTCVSAFPLKTHWASSSLNGKLIPSRTACASATWRACLSMAPLRSTYLACWSFPLNLSFMPILFKWASAVGVLRPDSGSETRVLIGPKIVTQAVDTFSSNCASVLFGVWIAECQREARHTKCWMINSLKNRRSVSTTSLKAIATWTDGLVSFGLAVHILHSLHVAMMSGILLRTSWETPAFRRRDVMLDTPAFHNLKWTLRSVLMMVGWCWLRNALRQCVISKRVQSDAWTSPTAASRKTLRCLSSLSGPRPRLCSSGCGIISWLLEAGSPGSGRSASGAGARSEPSGSWACASAPGTSRARLDGSLGCAPFLSVEPRWAMMACLQSGPYVWRSWAAGLSFLHPWQSQTICSVSGQRHLPCVLICLASYLDMWLRHAGHSLNAVRESARESVGPTATVGNWWDRRGACLFAMTPSTTAFAICHGHAGQLWAFASSTSWTCVSGQTKAANGKRRAGLLLTRLVGLLTRPPLGPLSPAAHWCISRCLVCGSANNTFHTCWRHNAVGKGCSIR